MSSETFGEKIDHLGEKIAEKTKKGKDAVKSSVHNAAEKVSEKTAPETLGSKISRKAKEVKENISEGAHNLSEKISEKSKSSDADK